MLVHRFFFKQERVGKNGKIFSIIKFRNMRNTVDEQGGVIASYVPSDEVWSFRQKNIIG
ncbi:sugar transferase [Enterocloster bolteae]|uniref:sugar transferase n=1 Tax=Enterocloster bolteae TaxID=208479 RepID=UPI00399F5C4F